ncbi:MAG: prepilin-type N-terminal cleavage/methylation domain-containing protein [Pseudomonadota bacterium]
MGALAADRQSRIRARPGPRPLNAARRGAGFTLPELIIVIVVGSVIAATLTVFFRPALDSWLALRVRGDLTAQASAALYTMKRDVRLAVPNSIRSPGDQCFELVPTSAGGRFRKDVDTVNAGSMPLDLNAGSTQFDVLSPLAAMPAVGDWVVVDNQNPGDVYAGSNRAAVSAVGGALANVRLSSITLAGAIDDSGYQGGRFVTVPNAQQAVFYVCSGAGLSGGNGTGTLTRYSRYGFNAAYPGACAAPGGTAAVLATRVKSCRFIYSPTAGATQQNGFVSMQLELTRNNETVSLLMGAHVMNAP